MEEFRFKEVGRQLSNWGRWGPDDQRGTVNLITPERRAAAGALITRGEVIDLGIAFDAEGPHSGGVRFNPIHRMTLLPSQDVQAAGLAIADDLVIMPLQCATQWDGLAHIGYDGALYNGVSVDTVTAQSGALHNGIEHVATELVGRGVLLDVARHRGVQRLSPSERITADELQAVAEQQRVEVRPGDILLVRTGWQLHFVDGDIELFMSAQDPGLDLSCCAWLRERDVAAVASDNVTVEVRPSPELPARLPLHMVLIRDMGMTLGEMFDLEALARDCDAVGSWEFFFSGVGLKVTGGVGSPLSPIVIR